MNNPMKFFLGLFFGIFYGSNVFAAKIGELTNSNVTDQIIRFFQFSDPSLVTSLIGCLLLGILCGTLGSFMVLRKMSLMGDTLGHAVLPGVCIAFMVTGTKHLFPTLIGATLSGLIGVLLINWIVQKSRIKSDAAMGMILSSFFGLGIVLLTMIQKSGSGNQSGLDQFLFGQAAALSTMDVWTLGVITVLTLFIVSFLFKELTVSTFDKGFAHSIGLPVPFIQNLLMIMTAIAVVCSIQAVGVVLVSAMLIIPPATAYMLVHRMSRLIIVAAFFGLLSGVIGAFLSFLGSSLPTGPFMVVTAGSFFMLAFLFAPQHGLVIRTIQQITRRRNTERENILKSIYHVYEQQDFNEPAIFLESLAAFRSETILEVRRKIKDLRRKKLVTLKGKWLKLTTIGMKKATLLVRNHRLWELFLVKEAQLPADHVHVGAEEIEHVLPASVIRELEETLNHAKIDPHGKPIPGI
jgi:ABC-type Mn2+/Zn2+ transport system permease subunit/Mn-dependent DtxR family transcriptional regulator